MGISCGIFSSFYVRLIFYVQAYIRNSFRCRSSQLLILLFRRIQHAFPIEICSRHSFNLFDTSSLVLNRSSMALAFEFLSTINLSSMN